jgi:arabinan endo-1,5-alpha-L-arabinosidase
MINWKSIASGINDNNRLLVNEGETLRGTLSEPLGWTDAYQLSKSHNENDLQTNIWASTVIYNKEMGKYCYYASSSVWGSTGSVIWFATSDNIEGPYEYYDAIVYSGFNNLTNEGKFYSRVNSAHYSFTNIPELFRDGVFSKKDLENAPWFKDNGEYDDTVYPNCIDPALFYDADGRLWMTYGSFFGGTYVMPIDESTGKPDYEYMKGREGYDTYFGKKIIATTFSTELSGEGAFITYDKESGYYYLFISYNGLGALGGYNIREYRSKNPDGPYFDAAGYSATDDRNTGTKLFGNYKFDCLDTAYLASGHSSCIIDDDGKIYQVYHTRFNVGHDGYETRMHQMARTETGFLTVLPFEYKGETIENKGYTPEEIAGEYEFIAHGDISHFTDSWSNAYKIISTTQKINLNADGTISDLKIYTANKADASLYSQKTEGNWKAAENAPYITVTIGNITYEGIICTQYNESKNNTPKLVFSAVGSNNECIWGVKK